MILFGRRMKMYDFYFPKVVDSLKEERKEFAEETERFKRETFSSAPSKNFKRL
jgi:hypothetical protein